MSIEPYLFFEGRCEEAIEFYKRAVGAEVVALMRHKETPVLPPDGRLPPGSGDKVMHAALKVGGSTVMVSDGLCNGAAAFGGFSLSLALPDAAAAGRAFAALADGGRVTMPLGETFWSPTFGMAVDKFGVSWMVTVAV